MSVFRDLQRLIRASRVTDTGDGTVGESFLNNVTGSGAGNQMTNYIMTASTWSNVPAGSPTVYSTPHTFTDLTLTFNTFGTKANKIQDKTTANWGVSYVSPLASAAATLNSISWTDNVGILNLTIVGEITPGSPSVSVTVWYQGYTNPYLPFGPGGNTNPDNCSPDCETVYNVDFTFSPGYIPPSGYTTNNLYLSYGTDRFNSGFNHSAYGPGPTSATAWSILQDRRGQTPTTTAIEWATDSGFTNVVSTSTTYTIGSDNNTSVSYYLRYKLDGAGSWTEYASNPVNWADPRPAT